MTNTLPERPAPTSGLLCRSTAACRGPEDFLAISAQCTVFAILTGTGIYPVSESEWAVEQLDSQAWPDVALQHLRDRSYGY
ncbi:hypothetical protein FKP32DRAFT_103586 [Trametes sanguinea]|nr:hypothetical protein FKP32DRAFT_103586 [Trametes sanguinea]